MKVQENTYNMLKKHAYQGTTNVYKDSFHQFGLDDFNAIIIARQVASCLYYFLKLIFQSSGGEHSRMKITPDWQLAVVV